MKAVVLIVDLRHPPTADDVIMYDFLKHYEIPCIVIATKADKIPKGKWQKHLKETRETLNMEEHDELIMFSSETGLGKIKHGTQLSRTINKKTAPIVKDKLLEQFFCFKM